MHKRMFLALALGATVILAACGSSSSTALTGKAWQLTAITDKVPAFQGVVPPADQSRYAINFNADGTFTGTADCNQFGGTYKTIGASGLTITPGISTMAACGEGSLDVLFVHGLSKAKSYVIVTETLTITLSDEGTMTFVVGPAASASPAASAGASAAAATAKPTAKPTAAPTTRPTPAPTAKPGTTAAPTPVPTPPGLIGKVWQLTGITEKNPPFQGAVPADQQANYTVEFVAGGTFSAKADCNTVSGTYVTADATTATGDLTMAPSLSTSAACGDASLGDLYVLGLSNAASYAIANGALTITLVDAGTLVYK